MGAPFALLALVVLHKTLHLPVVRREGVRIDYLGATLIVGGVSALLIRVSLAGHQFAWGSPATADGGRGSCCWPWRSGGIPDDRSLPAAVRAAVEDAYGEAVSYIFLVAAPFALLAHVAIMAMTEVPLRRTLDLEPADNDPVGADR